MKIANSKSLKEMFGAALVVMAVAGPAVYQASQAEEAPEPAKVVKRFSGVGSKQFFSVDTQSPAFGAGVRVNKDFAVSAKLDAPVQVDDLGFEKGVKVSRLARLAMEGRDTEIASIAGGVELPSSSLDLAMAQVVKLRVGADITGEEALDLTLEAGKKLIAMGASAAAALPHIAKGFDLEMLDAVVVTDPGVAKVRDQDGNTVLHRMFEVAGRDFAAENADTNRFMHVSTISEGLLEEVETFASLKKLASVRNKAGQTPAEVFFRAALEVRDAAIESVRPAAKKSSLSM